MLMYGLFKSYVHVSRCPVYNLSNVNAVIRPKRSSGITALYLEWLYCEREAQLLEPSVLHRPTSVNCPVSAGDPHFGNRTVPWRGEPGESVTVTYQELLDLFNYNNNYRLPNSAPTSKIFYHHTNYTLPPLIAMIVRISASSGFHPEGAITILSPTLQLRWWLSWSMITVSPAWALLASLVHDRDLRTPWIES